MNALVSIIIPCYNSKQRIHETLTSVEQQCIADLEVIVVDDGSTDGSADYVEAHFPQVQVIRVENGGPSRARNIGWRQASGEWIQFLDADDLLDPEKINRQLQVASSLTEEYAVVYSEWARFEDSLPQAVAKSSELITPTLQEMPVDLLRSDSFVATGSQIFRRSWLATVNGFDESMRLIEDVNLLIRIAMAGGKFHFAKAGYPLFFYRQHPQSLSRGKPVEFQRSCLKNVALVDDYLTSRGPLTSYQQSILVDAYGSIARNTYRVAPETFEAALSALERITGTRYIPSGPQHMTITSRLLGYRTAENIAYRYRALKSFLRRAASATNPLA